MFIFLIYSLSLCCGNVSNSNVTMKFAQLHYFYHKILGEKKLLCPPLSKRWGTCHPRPPLKLGPWLQHMYAACFDSINRIFWMLLLSKDTKNKCESYIIRRLCVWSIFKAWRFLLVGLWRLKILLPPGKHDFYNSVSLNAFASKAVTNAVIVGNSSKNLKFLVDRSWRASKLSFSALRKWISVILFSPRNGPHSSIRLARAYHQPNPSLRLLRQRIIYPHLHYASWPGAMLLHRI